MAVVVGCSQGAPTGSGNATSATSTPGIGCARTKSLENDLPTPHLTKHRTRRIWKVKVWKGGNLVPVPRAVNVPAGIIRVFFHKVNRVFVSYLTAIVYCDSCRPEPPP